VDSGGEILFDYFGAIVTGAVGFINYLRGNDATVFGDIDSLGYNAGAASTNPLESVWGLNALVILAPPPQYDARAIVGTMDQTHTMLTNFSWARLNDSGTNTRVDLINDVMDWLSGTTAIEEPVVLPVEFSLSQNYPNPFNAITTISYALPTTGNVRIQVYDIMGRVVGTLENGTVPAGYNQATWDAQGMPSGLYFLRLSTDQFSETMKMMLLK
jgi:hypothetical protein